MTRKQRQILAKIADDALCVFGTGIKSYTADGIYRLEYKPEALAAITRALHALEEVAQGKEVSA